MQRKACLSIKKCSMIKYIFFVRRHNVLVNASCMTPELLHLFVNMPALLGKKRNCVTLLVCNNVPMITQSLLPRERLLKRAVKYVHQLQATYHSTSS